LPEEYRWSGCLSPPLGRAINLPPRDRETIKKHAGIVSGPRWRFAMSITYGGEILLRVDFDTMYFIGVLFTAVLPSGAAGAQVKGPPTIANTDLTTLTSIRWTVSCPSIVTAISPTRVSRRI